MFKKFTVSAVAAALMLTTMPAAFAGGGDAMIYPPSSSVSFSVSAQTEVKAEKAIIYADFNVYGDGSDTSRKEVLDKLNAAYNQAKQTLSPYGKVNRSGMNIYTSTPYYEPMVKEDGTTEPADPKMFPPTFSGYLSVQVTVTDLSKVDTVKDLLLTDLEFNSSWVDFPLSDSVLVNAEKNVADTVRNLIAERKKVYETVLGHNLGAISSLSMSTWADSNTFDSVTGMVKATVSAWVNFY